MTNKKDRKKQKALKEQHANEKPKMPFKMNMRLRLTLEGLKSSGKMLTRKEIAEILSGGQVDEAAFDGDFKAIDQLVSLLRNQPAFDNLLHAEILHVKGFYNRRFLESIRER